ncbi:MAG TPA: hypothetical protein VG738_21665 [Chitinophagaceae bacterium]|nr:hypothetical protein [Chitinophagaceae bacterium]
MHKRINTKAVFFKAMLVAVFGIFFFVQAQSEFIYCAYNNDFPSVFHHNAPAQNDFHSNVKAEKSAKDALAHVKLNKRYQVVTAQAILPASLAIPVYEAARAEKCCLLQVRVFTLFVLTKSLRGPPSV